MHNLIHAMKHCSLPFSTFQILFYALRPGFVRSQRPTKWHFMNIAVQLIFNYIVYLTFGPRSLIYFIFSSFFAGSLHPLAGHFIAEHYLWDSLDQETYSYYGPLNILAYNVGRSYILYVDKMIYMMCFQVGYHNEHHDFPSVPWTRLPLLHELAPEFYKTLPSHPSWPMIIVNFIRDKEVGIFARAKRLAKGSGSKKETIVPLDGGCADETASLDGSESSLGNEENAGNPVTTRRRCPTQLLQ